MPSQIANYIHRVESKKRSLDDVARKSPPRSRLNASETCQHACSASVQTARPDDIRQLQQTAGNRAVEQLLAGYHLSPKDAMGGPRASTDLDDNLNLHDSADSHEVNPLEEGSLLGMGLQQRIDASRGAGGSLSSPIRQQMEHSLGTELADVRVHTDPSADTLAQAVNAQAFTTGRDIFFRRNAYRPETAAGRKVLAHELAHVVQQGSLKGGMNGSLRLGRRGDHLEQEADRTARAVAEHPGSAATAGRSAAGQVSAATVQRVYEESTPIPLDEHGPESESAADQESKATTPEEEQSRRYKWVRKGKMKWEQKLRKEKKGKKEKQENMFTVPKLPEYNEEETKGFMDAGTQHAPTYYHPGGQPNPYQTRVQGGLLKRGGKSMDTVGTIPQFAKDKANRHMFTMGAEGEMMTANVGANAAKHGPFHHTSMSGGGRGCRGRRDEGQRR